VDRGQPFGVVPYMGIDTNVVAIDFIYGLGFAGAWGYIEYILNVFYWH
jgi:hypothetical protein